LTIFGRLWGAQRNSLWYGKKGEKTFCEYVSSGEGLRDLGEGDGGKRRRDIIGVSEITHRKENVLYWATKGGRIPWGGKIKKGGGGLSKRVDRPSESGSEQMYNGKMSGRGDRCGRGR